MPLPERCGCKRVWCIGVCVYCMRHLGEKSMDHEQDGFWICKKCMKDPELPAALK